ncbi:hypothetical protein C7N43_33700 [Sphingobacteriales bacterium UPWRP_1]|nr:hypothetical protein B6N25_13180 [Sphingobacteriales bacterium TSM_CSS]PSJ72549.1 hypothetical protein C7N43_33700 [Sphingobacteriales bacterium UPWRP_1]
MIILLLYLTSILFATSAVSPCFIALGSITFSGLAYNLLNGTYTPSGFLYPALRWVKNGCPNKIKFSFYLST